MALALNPNVMGLIVSGDIGEYTLYTDRWQRKVAFPKAPPQMPARPAQIVQRNRFKDAQADYKALTANEKLDWENLAKKTSVAATGQNLFIHFSLCCDPAELATLNRLASMHVPYPPSH